MSDSEKEVTQVLLLWNGGDEGAVAELIPLVYEELRRLAFSEDEMPENAEGPASLAEAAAQPAEQPELTAVVEPEPLPEPAAAEEEKPAETPPGDTAAEA